MATFITCWLQDPGELPPGDGPPGGGGDFGGKDDDDDPPCTETYTYCGCSNPTNLDEVDLINDVLYKKPPCDAGCKEVEYNCNDFVPDCITENGITLCRDDKPETHSADTCLRDCTKEPIMCAGFVCLGQDDGIADDCTEQDIATDYDMYQGVMCGKANPFGCDDVTYPCDPPPMGVGDIYYETNLDCQENEADCQGLGPCSGWTCTEKSCDGTDGTCTYGPLPDSGSCKQHKEPNCSTGDWWTCTDGDLNSPTTYYNDKNTCTGSDECVSQVYCTVWTCSACEENPNCGDCTAPLGEDVDENCCEAVQIPASKNDAYCEASYDGEECTATCVQDPININAYCEKIDCNEACAKCQGGYECKGGSPGSPGGGGGFVIGDCEQSTTDEDPCMQAYSTSTSSCEYESNPGVTCFDDETKCLETGCECSGFVLCELAELPNSTDPGCGTVCEPIGWTEDEGCQYDNGDAVLNNKTCHQLYTDHKASTYYHPFDGKNTTVGDATTTCESTCNVSPPDCYTCESADCYECQSVDNQDFKDEECVFLAGKKNCVKSGVAQSDGDEGWECIGADRTLNSDCNDLTDCDLCNGEGEYIDDECSNQCGIGFEGGLGEGFAQFGGRSAYERIYGFGDNPIYDKYINNNNIKNPTKFVEVHRGTIRSDLFKNKIHVGIKAVNQITNKQIRFSDNPYTDLSDSNLEKSIHEDIILKLNLARKATGQNIKKTFFSGLRNLIVSNRLDSLNLPEILNLLDKIIRLEKDEKYRDTREYVSIGTVGATINEAKALELALNKVWPLNPDNYSENRMGDRVRSFKTLAPDLQKSLPTRLSSGELTHLYYDINDQIPLSSTGYLTMGNGDLQWYTRSDGTTGVIPVASLIDRAGVLSIEALQKVFYLLGETYSYNIKVSTDETKRVDERYGLANERKNFYMLTLETNTITEEDRDNPFVAVSKAGYKYETSGPSRNDWVDLKEKGAPFPYLQVYVDAEDPIFSYLQNDGTVEVTCKDFVLDIFDQDLDDNTSMPVMPRRIPQTIVLYPTDRSTNLLTHSISKSTSYGVRELEVIPLADPDRSDIWNPVFLKEKLTYPNTGINPSIKDSQAINYSIDTQDINDQFIYASGTPFLPRKAWGERQVFKIAKEMKDDYQLPSNNTINWYEIYERMSIPEMKYLHKEISDFTKFKSRLNRGKPSSVDSVNKLYPKVKDYKSRSFLGTEGDSTSIKYLQVKPDHIPTPPEPLE
jgi:hypothetical protein